MTSLRAANPSLFPGTRWRTHLVLGWLMLLGGTASFAQLGDAKGERQEPLVPREQIPPAPALSPQEALTTFTVAPGYALELAAADPLVRDPVAIAFGRDGRMWVVEMRGFMPDLDGTGEDAPVGRVVVLSDRDGDGRFDHSSVFVDGLVLPRTVLPVGAGALIGAPPELAFWQDADGDGRAEKKTVLAADYGVKVDPQRPYFANPELAPNGLRWAFDNWIYSAAYTKKFRYRAGQWETAPTSFRGQWGLTQDDDGRFYHNSNADQLRVDVIAAEYLQRNPNFPQLAGVGVNAAADQFVWPVRVTPGVNRGYRPEVLRDGRLKQFTAACAPWVYRGDLLPELRGSVFVAEPAANLVRRNILGTDGRGELVARNAYERREFIASTDERFRPVNFATGPDGALYVVDLYRGVLQHRLSLTSYLRGQSVERKLVEPRHLGRIYRVVPAGRPPARMTRLPALSTSDWVQRLAHPNAWWRETAQQLLVERADRATLPALRTLARGDSAAGRIHALWTLDGIGGFEAATLLPALRDADPVVRAGAIRLGERWLASADREKFIAAMVTRTADPEPAVRRQAVLSLGEAKDPAVDLVVARAVLAHADTPYLLDAFYSGLAGRELPLIEGLMAPHDGRASEARLRPMLAALAGAVLTSRASASIERLLTVADAALPTAPERARSLVEGMAAAAGRERRPVQLDATPAMLTRWAENRALAEPVAVLAKTLAWPGKPIARNAAVAPLTAEQQARFETGRQIFTGVCAGCHQASGSGMEGLAPPLLDSEWVLGRPERLIRVLLHGLSGPIKVRKRQYTGDMPAFGAVMKDDQIAAVLTYIRREWGHAAPAVDPAAVAAERAATQGHSGAWSAEELRWIGDARAENGGKE